VNYAGLDRLLKATVQNSYVTFSTIFCDRDRRGVNQKAIATELIDNSCYADRKVRDLTGIKWAENIYWRAIRE